MKTVTEIAVTLENKPGRLSEAVELLGANGIALMGLTLAAEAGSSRLWFVTNEPDRAANILRSSNYEPMARPVLAVEAPMHPGGLNTILRILKTAGVNIERLYSGDERSVSDGPIYLVAVDNPSTAFKALASEWITLYGEEAS
jgi:hypothetical protein